MVDNYTLYTVPQLIAKDAALWLPYAAFFMVPLTEDSGSAPAFTNTQDSLGIIPGGYPYPAGGFNLGIINSSVNINPGSNLKDDEPFDLGLVSSNAYFEKYSRQIEFELFASRRKIIRDLFNDPGARSNVDSAGGGVLSPTEGNLVLMFADVNNPDVFLCLIHFLTKIIPQQQVYGNNTYSLVKAVFRCYAGDNPNDPGCLRNPEAQVWRELWIDSDGTWINPNDSTYIIDPAASNNSFVAISMFAGMMFDV